MQATLESWKERLDRHFQELARHREGSGLPLFAFEHCFSVEEIEQVGQLLRGHLSTQRRPRTYWLLWVIYAAEIGYNYTGDEYWQSFEKKTPGWDSHHRYELRQWFMKFQETYHGFKPSGLWAEHFKIIAWPVTHAILPKYLQYQFAKMLYQERYRLAGLTTLDSVSVGRLLAGHTYSATTRFEKFLQQKELTGRIVLGLLDQAPQGAHEPIYPETLKRIVADLDDVRKTRNWIRDTKRTVIDRFKGIRQGTGSGVRRPDSISNDELSEDTFNQPDIRPNMLLRYSGSGKWAVAVDIPNFAPLAALHSDLGVFLKQTRCRVAGAVGTKPAGWTIYGTRSTILKSWPDPNNPLLEFVQQHVDIEQLLQDECRISQGPSWLFRVGADGRAREIRGHNVHPGVLYILVSTEEYSAPLGALINPCMLECEGVHAVHISVPQNLSEEDTSQLKALGLEVARTVRVWPAGLPCRGWDGEGQSEWLTTEHPQIGIIHDHPVQSYLVCLDKIFSIEIDAPDSGEPVFIQLDPLPAGTHHLVVTAHRQSSSGDQPLSGYIELKVREPEPWIPGVPAHKGLVVNLDPYDANLNEFWANKLDLSIGGPESHAVTCFVSLENSAGKQLLLKQVNGRFQLPVTSDAWKSELDKVVSQDKNEWRYFEASSGELKIHAEELGNYFFRFERDTLPLRWVTRNRHSRLFLYLVDDTGLEDSEAVCHFYSMNSPLKEEQRYTTTEMLKGINPLEPGGLYIVQNGPHKDALVVSCNPAGFRDLEVTSDYSNVLHGNITAEKILRVLGLWSNSRIVGGFLAERRRNKIATQIHAKIYEKLCGMNWAKAEAAFIDNPASEQVLEEVFRRVGRNNRFKTALWEDKDKTHGELSQAIRWYSELSCRFDVCNDPMLPEFAVILACEPHALSDRYPTELDQLTKKAASNPEVLRGARFANLFIKANETGNIVRESQ